jgi:hypothetical protein
MEISGRKKREYLKDRINVIRRLSDIYMGID